MRNVVNADAEAGPGATPPLATLDLLFLDTQTFGDADLAREVLTLFADQARRVVPTLPDLTPTAQREAAHLLKGSARGIGAWASAAAAETYEVADGLARRAIYPDVVAAFDAACAEIETHLGETGQPRGV